MSKPKRLSSGKYMDFDDFTTKDVDIKDIHVSLNNILRFTGHWKEVPPLTVAQHSWLCYYLARMDDPENAQLHLHVFIHDFAEAYVGDVSSPVKWALGKAWYDFAKPIENIVQEALTIGVPITPDLHEAVKFYDLAALDIERRVMWSNQNGKSNWPDGGLNKTLKEKTDIFNLVASNYDVNIEAIYKELYDLALQTTNP